METVSSLGSAAGSATSVANSSDPTTLGQADFLALMTAQLQNQDPFKPMENGDFLAQMAQFSTVSGIETLNETMSEISLGLDGNRLTEAAVMLGRSALVPGTLARPDAAGDIRGAVELSSPASNVTIRYSDPDTFATLHVQELGAQPTGKLDIGWTSPPAEIVDGHRAVRISVEAEGAGALQPHVYAAIEGVHMPETADGDLIFTVEDYGLFSALEISSIR